MPVNYEVEYDNRGRVPEHPAILARMAEDAKAYRASALAATRAELDVIYGSSPRQIVDIFRSPAGADAPVAMFIHGGYWRALQPSAFSQVAAGLNARGVTVVLAGYDLCPQVSISQIVDQMRQACIFLRKRSGKRILVLGHSAGGHLAAAMLATDWQKFNAPPDLVPAAMGISGLYDLAPMIATSMNADFKLDEPEARRLSPLFWPAPAGKTFDAVVGGAESSEFLRQSRTLVDAWSKAGVKTRYDAPAGANHFTVIEPLTDPNSAMVNRLLELLPRG
ncbi:MAG: alpha/beta hydrolase [Xanthobacteraceae bacterium]